MPIDPGGWSPRLGSPAGQRGASVHRPLAAVYGWNLARFPPRERKNAPTNALPGSTKPLEHGWVGRFAETWRSTRSDSHEPEIWAGMTAETRRFPGGGNLIGAWAPGAAGPLLRCLR